MKQTSETIRKFKQAVLVTLVIMSSGSSAVAKDLDKLAEFVRPAYTAMNYAVLCARNNPFFLADTSGPRGTALHYAEHVKNEAIDGLSEADAVTILKIAAGEARSTARQQLYKLVRDGDDSATGRAIRDWCDVSGKTFILDFIRHHDTTHTEAVEFLQRAKK